MSIQATIYNRLAAVLWGAALLAFVLAVAGLALFHSMTLEQRVRQIMEPYAQLVAVGTEAAVAFEDPTRAQEVLDTLRANPQIQEADIFLDDGRMLASLNHTASEPPRSMPTLADGIYLNHDTAKLLQGLGKGGRLRIVMGLEQLSQQTHQLLWLFGAGMLVLLAATLGQLAVLRRTIIQPIASLTVAAERVRLSADYRHRVPVVGADELARLGESFNAMLEAVEEREMALSRLNAFHRTILDNAAYAIVSTSADGTVTSFNLAAERLLGYTADELIGQHTPALWHDAAEIQRRAQTLSAELGVLINPGFEVFTAHSQRGLREENEWTFICKDGTRVPVNLSITALQGEGGAVSGFVGLVYDLTERKQAQHQLQLLTYALDQVKESIFLMPGNDPKFLYANQGAANRLGYSRDELTRGMGVFDIDPSWSPDVWEKFWPVLSVSRQMQFETSHRTRDGRVFPVEVTGNCFEFDGKTYNLAICRDISERKNAEKLLSEYAAIIESTEDAIIGKTLDSVITSWNKGAERMFGYRADEIVGQSIAILIPGECQNEEREIQDRVRRGESIRHYETIRRRKDGQLIDVSVTVSPLRNSQGEIVGASKIARDITDRKRAENELMRYRNELENTVQQRTAELLLARDAAEAANKAKSVFLANMSHELRTPMNAILGFSAILLKNARLQDGDRANVEIINRSGEHLLNLINDVLEMAKIEAGRVQLEDAPFDLGEMVLDVMKMMQVRAAEKNLQIVVDQSSSFPRYIIGDQARLRQILINLVGNALKFTQQGGVVIRLSTKNNAIAHLLIEVEDSGPGIAAEDQKHIFEPFVQIGQLADNKGTGLGLSITRQFVQLMKGSISLESAPGKGSLFRIDVPLKQAQAADITDLYRLEERMVLGLMPGQDNYRILVIEDQLENRLLLVNLMEAVGFQVKVAENGELGVACFQSWQPHLIWMDIQMPVMDGLEATRIIRSLPGGKQVKIVAVTASAFTEQRADIMAAGMDDLICKPFRANEIYDCLTRLLGVRYVYADSPAMMPEDVILTPEMLSVVPQNLREDLQLAVNNLDSERIGGIIQQIAAYDLRVAAALTRLAEAYEYPTILNVLGTN
ncbi:PAS domain S-box protein [Methylomonas sp. TEB]|uniref:PAS domain S-box protein n=1 Tax=Methylomonas sp. TEB TaxID=3398229 RepID=UPI0039F4856F